MMSNTVEPVPITPDAIEILEPSRIKLRTLRVLPYYVPPKTETEEPQIAIPKAEKVFPILPKPVKLRLLPKLVTSRTERPAAPME